MPSLLGVREDRHGRSKSPGGRERDRSHSRDTRAKSPPKREQRRSSKKYESESESSTESEHDRKYERRDRRSSKKYEEEDDNRYRRTKTSKKYTESESEESDRHRSSKYKSKRDEEDSDDRRRREKVKKSEKKRSDSDDDKRKGKDRGSKKKSKESESSGSEDIKSSIHRKSKDKKEEDSNGVKSPMAPAYGQPPYGYPAPGYQQPYAPPPPVKYNDTRHMSYGGHQDPRYAAPGGFPGQSAELDRHRTGSFNGYADVGKYQYAQTDPHVAYKYNDTRDREKDREYERDRELRRAYEREKDRGRETEKERDRDRDHKLERKYSEDKYARTEKVTRYPDDKPASPPDEVKRRLSRLEERENKLERQYSDDKYARTDRDRKGSLEKPAMRPDELARRVSQLSVGATLGEGAATLGVDRRSSFSGGKPPASPLLEAYKGTYQSISPMPSALVLAKHDSDISDVELEERSPSDSDDGNVDLKRKIKKLERERDQHRKDRGEKLVELDIKGKEIFSIERRKDEIDIDTRPIHRITSTEDEIMVLSSNGRKKVSFYDPKDDAKRLAVALQGTHNPPNGKVLVQVLPRLTQDDLNALKIEYKHHAKVGGQGINLAKHIKLRVTGSLGKAAYATALGRWESEAHWANSWYQGGATRRELLIESLMGRTNQEIREIKNCFKDKRYSDDLEKCMKAELKADKFRTAVLLALEERRMADSAPLDPDLVEEDVQKLYRALNAPGGETLMIQTIVLRSDAHLRAVMRLYERIHKVNFARAMIAKSQNLVGETLAHILNGALNRQMRDALLLHQAISESAPGKERTELLISRLVRMHWEPKHQEKVKAVYMQRYRVPLEHSIREDVLKNMKTDEGRLAVAFCIELVRSSV